MAAVLFHPDQQLQLLHIKIVSKYDRDRRLAFPVGLLHHLWPQGVPHTGTIDFTVLDVHGLPWRLVCNLRRTADGDNPKPEVFGPAWKQLIKHKEIRVGDQLVFYLPPPPADEDAAVAADPVFVISFRREIRLLGTPFQAHILV